MKNRKISEDLSFDLNCRKIEVVGLKCRDQPERAILLLANVQLSVNKMDAFKLGKRFK